MKGAKFQCPKRLEKWRVELYGQLGDKKNGCLDIQSRGIHVIFSDGEGWEHVSVACQYHPPTWYEMSWIKRQFWPADATVMQLHVPESEHIDINKNVLHLWRPIGVKIPRPPADLV